MARKFAVQKFETEKQKDDFIADLRASGVMFVRDCGRNGRLYEVTYSSVAEGAAQMWG